MAPIVGNGPPLRRTKGAEGAPVRICSKKDANYTAGR